MFFSSKGIKLPSEMEDRLKQIAEDSGRKPDELAIEILGAEINRRYEEMVVEKRLKGLGYIE